MIDPGRVLGAALMIASGAGVAASFCRMAAIFFIAGIATAVVAGLIVSSGIEDDWL